MSHTSAVSHSFPCCSQIFKTFFTWQNNLLRHYATNCNVAVSIPDGVIGFLIDLMLPAALSPWASFSL
jgi:hypothetical protein